MTSFLAGSSVVRVDLLKSARRKIHAIRRDRFQKEICPGRGRDRVRLRQDGWDGSAFTHAGAPGISLWRNIEGKRLERVKLPDVPWNAAGELRPSTTTMTDGWPCRGRRNRRGGELRLFPILAPALG